MPLFLALIASALFHVGAVVAPGWVLPEILEPDPPPTIDAVLAKPPVRPEPAPVARPAPKPPQRKPMPPSPVEPVIAARTPSELAAVAPATPAAAASAAPVAAPPPAEEPPQAVAPAPTFDAPAPQPVNTALPNKGHMRYVITRGDGGFVIGQAVHSWDHDGISYRLKSMTETIGIAALFKPARIVQSSQGEVTAQGLRPREFRHERAGGIDTAIFDWERRVVAYAGREESLAEGTQDMLSMYYQLVLLAPGSGTLELPIATGRKLSTYRFDVLGEETLGLPQGERRTMHIRTRSGKDIVEMWLPVGEGEQARGLPLKIRILDRKGEIYEQIVDDLPASETK